MITTREKAPAEVLAGDVVEDDSGDARVVISIEEAGDEVVFHDGCGEALIVGKARLVTVREVQT